MDLVLMMILFLEKYLFVYVENDCRCYIINKFKFKYYEDETDNLKYINLDNFYKSNEELSILEQWKKVVFRQKSFKDKITLLLPFIYHNFDMLYNLFQMENIDCTIIYACLTSCVYEEYIDVKYMK